MYRSRQMVPTLVVLATAFLIVLAVVPFAYYAGKQWQHERHYLDNHRPPSDYQAYLSYAMQYARESSGSQ